MRFPEQIAFTTTIADAGGEPLSSPATGSATRRDQSHTYDGVGLDMEVTRSGWPVSMSMKVKGQPFRSGWTRVCDPTFLERGAKIRFDNFTVDMMNSDACVELEMEAG